MDSRDEQFIVTEYKYYNIYFMDYDSDIVVMKEIRQEHIRVSDHETSFADIDEHVPQKQEDIEYEVHRSTIKPFKTKDKPKNNTNIVLILALTGLLFVLILIAFSLSPIQQVQKKDGDILDTDVSKLQVDSDLYPLSQNEPQPIKPQQQQAELLHVEINMTLLQQIMAASTKQEVIEPPITEQITILSILDNSFVNPGPKQLKQVYIPIPNPEIKDQYNLHTAISEHRHVNTPLNYSTMGIPEVGKQFNFTVVRQDQLYEYESIMDEVFRPYNDTNCELERYGDQYDGGYLLCKNLMNLSVALINLGVQGRDNFGCKLTSAFPMANYQYDCTNKLRPYCRDNNGLNFFSSSCLGDRTENSPSIQFFSLKDIVDSRNLTHKRVTMKIDVQGGEWPGFRTFPLEYLDYVDQFILEIHNPGPSIKQGAYWGNDDIIKSLGQKFVSVNLHMNNNGCVGQHATNSKIRKFPSFAIEVTMVNKRLITLFSNSRSYRLDPKNYINAPNLAECQMSD